MTKLKSIALELLQKYEETQTSLIWEYSGDIDKGEENLDAEVAKYRELIDKYAEQEPISVSVSEKEPDEISEEVTLRFFRNSLKVRWQDLVIYNVEWLKKNWQMEMDIVCGVKPCDDVVSRQAVLDALVDADNWAEEFDSIKALPSVTPKPTECEDAVSRQAVLDLIEHYNSDGLGSVFYGYEQGVKFADAVNKLPSVRPQEPEIVKYGWTKIPKCTTCKYWYSPIVPCSRCKDNSEFKPRESDEISERNMKMWEELFKAEREDKK